MPEARYKRLQLGQEKKLVLCRKNNGYRGENEQILKKCKKKIETSRNL